MHYLTFTNKIICLLDRCYEITCPIENEICDSKDGLCKCGTTESCGYKSWAPTCNPLIGGCTCGTNPSPCNENTEICDQTWSTGDCLTSTKIVIRIKNHYLFSLFINMKHSN